MGVEMIDPEYELEKQKIIQLYLDQGWKPITEDIKDGTMYMLLVEKSEHPLFDHLFPITIGINNYLNDDVDHWHLSGWCWSHDHFTEDKEAVPLLYKEFEHNFIC